MNPLNHMKKVSFMLTVIIALLALTLSTCLAQENILRFNNQGTEASPNLTPPSDKPWVFFDLPLGKYRFDTGVQVEQMHQNKVSPIEKR